MNILRNKVFLVGLVCIAPVVLGWGAYLFDWAPGTTDNYGELISLEFPRARLVQGPIQVDNLINQDVETSQGILAAVACSWITSMLGAS